MSASWKKTGGEKRKTVSKASQILKSKVTVFTYNTKPLVPYDHIRATRITNSFCTDFCPHPFKQKVLTAKRTCVAFLLTYLELFFGSLNLEYQEQLFPNPS